MSRDQSTVRGVEESSHFQVRLKAIAGALVGTAVGDALGLPMEGLGPERLQRLCPFPLRHRFLGRYGMISDDTEHTLMVAQALLEQPQDPQAFARVLSWRLRWWLVALPAGVGLATLRAIVKLWLGFPPHRSGVYSAGNGPAMRSAVLGAYFAEDSERRRLFVGAATRLSHSDPRAEVAALAVAEAAAWSARADQDLAALLQSLDELSADEEWRRLMQALREGLEKKYSVAQLVEAQGWSRGVSGYAYQTVPVALYAALVHRDDFRSALTAVIACGGDTDTVAAITGALVGTRVGSAQIPSEWRSGMVEWPRSMRLLERVASRLVEQESASKPLGSLAYCWWMIPLRNLIFLIVVLLHGFRRLLPPY